MKVRRNSKEWKSVVSKMFAIKALDNNESLIASVDSLKSVISSNPDSYEISRQENSPNSYYVAGPNGGWEIKI